MAGYEELTPRDYGASGGGADDTTALLAWIAAVQSDRTKTGKLDDYYVTNRPLRINTSGTRIFGVGPKCGINMSNDGPAIIVAGTESALPLVASIRPDLPASERAFDFTNWSGHLCLNDMGNGGASINGCSHFMLRCWYKPSSVADGFTIIQSAGALTENAGLDSAFTLANSAGTLSAGLKIGSTTYVVTDSGGLSAGTIYFLALTYDGTTIRLYKGPSSGTANLVASRAVAGTITQKDWEDVVMGQTYVRTFMAKQLGNGPQGVVDHLNIEASASSSVGEYTTSSFTVPAGYGFTGSTKILMPFETGVTGIPDGDDMIATIRTPGYAFVPAIRATYPASVNRVRLEGFAVNSVGIGVVAHGAQDSLLKDLWVTSGSHGIQVLNNSYNTCFDGLTILPSSTTVKRSAGLMLVGACWVDHIRNLKVQGGGFGLVSINSTGVHSGGYLVAQRYAAALVSGLGGGGEWHALDYAISDEGGFSSMLAGAILDSASGQMRGVSFSIQGNPTMPFIIWDHDNSFKPCMIIDGCEFISTATPPNRHTFRGPYSTLDYRRNAIKPRGNHFRLASSEFTADGI